MTSTSVAGDSSGNAGSGAVDLQQQLDTLEDLHLLSDNDPTLARELLLSMCDKSSELNFLHRTTTNSTTASKESQRHNTSKNGAEGSAEGYRPRQYFSLPEKVVGAWQRRKSSSTCKPLASSPGAFPQQQQQSSSPTPVRERRNFFTGQAATASSDGVQTSYVADDSMTMLSSAPSFSHDASTSNAVNGGSEPTVADPFANIQELDSGKERMKRIKLLRKNSASYPACLLLTLDTIHQVDEKLRWSVADLDEAVRKAEQEVRNLRTELRRHESAFQRLEPDTAYIQREWNTIFETIKSEEKKALNEKGVLREKLAAAIDSRNAVQARTVELTKKLALLKKHVNSVKVANEADHRTLVETYPSLTEKELQLGVYEVDALIDERKKMLRDLKGSLLKNRVRYEHTLGSVSRQVLEREAELHQLKVEAVLFEQGPTDNNNDGSSSPRPEPQIVVFPPISSAPNEVATTEAERKQQQHHLARHVPSIDLFHLTKRNKLLHSSPNHHSQQKRSPARLHRSAPAASMSPRPLVIVVDVSSLLRDEHCAREQLKVIFSESLQLLARDVELERLDILERTRELRGLRKQTSFSNPMFLGASPAAAAAASRSPTHTPSRRRV